MMELQCLDSNLSTMKLSLSLSLLRHKRRRVSSFDFTCLKWPVFMTMKLSTINLAGLYGGV